MGDGIRVDWVVRAEGWGGGRGQCLQEYKFPKCSRSEFSFDKE